MENYNTNPFTEQEIENVKEKYRIKFENGEGINKAYGTSLIAAAITPWYWFAYHIGDGRFSVLYQDGSGEQPVIVDEKCFLNVTTSICDDDILEREQKNPGTNDMVPAGVRSFLSFHADKPPPIAFFLCTDGIDDNYPVEGNENHLYRLYRTIAVTFTEDGYESTCNQLKELANEFATKGKGDDTSIAGIVNIEELKKVVPEWKEKEAMG
jgi:serine/threonine protein phosphatase PrpC